MQRCLMKTFKELRFAKNKDPIGTRITLPIFFGEPTTPKPG